MNAGDNIELNKFISLATKVETTWQLNWQNKFQFKILKTKFLFIDIKQKKKQQLAQMNRSIDQSVRNIHK